MSLFPIAASKSLGDARIACVFFFELGKTFGVKCTFFFHSDTDQVSDYAEDAMVWATACGLINGMGDGTLAPQEISTRAQVAQIIMNYDQKIA